jgi:cellulose synthase/poly-beta-1,6-N-acetylglucosamine synthase-like glycosyltransferase
VSGPTPDQHDRPDRRYCLITPCRDEAAYARQTIESVAKQTLPPTLWVIVDDGSTDGTPEIVEDDAARLPHRLIRRADRGHRRVGVALSKRSTSATPASRLPITSISASWISTCAAGRISRRARPRMEAEPRLGSISGKPGSCIRGPVPSCRKCAVTKCRWA